MDQPPAVPEPDDKDWTWILGQPCPECGFSAAIEPARIAGLIRRGVERWVAVLQRPDVAARPAPAVWSPLEYACHVRDVCRIFDRRLELMLTTGDPLFDNWDQDATALQERYWMADPAVVAEQISAAGTTWADRYATVTDDQWERTGRRSNGSVFTVAGLGRYGLHDVVHHLYDVGEGWSAAADF